MIYMRGQAADYDHWRQLGLTGWGWDDVLPVFRKHEDHYKGPASITARAANGASRRRGCAGPSSTSTPGRERSRHPATDDFNRGDNEGVAYFEVNQKRGRRWSAARGFLRPALKRDNLRVVTGCVVDKLVIENGRANVRHLAPRARRAHGVGPRRDHPGERRDRLGADPAALRHRPAGLAARGRRSRSGIPRRRRRQPAGPSAAAPHLQGPRLARTLNEMYASLWRRGWMGVQYACARRGPMTAAPSQLGVFARSGPDRERADLQFHIQPLSLDRFGEPLHPFPGLTSSVCNLQPTSRGWVRVTSPTRTRRPRSHPTTSRPTTTA
jgi:choline dehydrogenase